MSEPSVIDPEAPPAPPHITHCMSGGASEYDWAIRADGLTFEEALSLTEALGAFIRARKQLQRAVMALPALSQTDGDA